MLPLVREHLDGLRADDAAELRRMAGDADDLDPTLAARAPHRRAYRGLETLVVHLEARRGLLFDRFPRALERPAARGLPRPAGARSGRARALRARPSLIGRRGVCAQS